MSDNRLSRYVLTDELYALLKRRILAHEMAAGDKINIDKLARDLGVSNIPIRESLFRLASEGFVTVVPFKGMFVAEMNMRDIDEIFEIRLQLEELAIRKATGRIPAERLSHMLRELQAQEETPGPEETESETRVLRMNEGLHGTILAYADNANLMQMVTSLIERIYRYLNLHHFAIELRAEKAEHEQVVQALLEGDTDSAVAAMKRHLNSAHARLRSNFA